MYLSPSSMPTAIVRSRLSRAFAASSAAATIKVATEKVSSRTSLQVRYGCCVETYLKQLSPEKMAEGHFWSFIALLDIGDELLVADSLRLRRPSAGEGSRRGEAALTCVGAVPAAAFEDVDLSTSVD